MSNRKHIWFTLFIIVALLLLTAGPANARVTKTPFTGTDLWVEDLDPGTETAPPDSGLSRVRGAVSRFALEVTDPRVSGDNKATVNWNSKVVDPPVYVSGRMWGTFSHHQRGRLLEGRLGGISG